MSVFQEVHPLPKVDDTLSQLTGAKLFTKLDANSGFWQIPLSPTSRLLTTFITPSGRYCFNKLPFSISSAPELFQKRMNSILHGLEGMLCLIDDDLVFGRDREEHDQHLLAAQEKIKAAGATINPEKCEFGKTSLKFLSHIINQEGIRADPDKTAAIQGMKPHTAVPELRRFMGMVNQLGKFTPNLAQLTQPLKELLSKNVAWLWGPAQEEAFSLVKVELSKATTLLLYDPAKDLKVSANALWPWSSSATERGLGVETSSVCLTLDDQYRTLLRSDRKGGTRHYMGFREVQLVRPGKVCHCGN